MTITLMPENVKSLIDATSPADVTRGETEGEAAGAGNSGLSELDVYLFRRGQHGRLYRHFGAHAATQGGRPGTRFTVWAPNARRVSVIGDFNGWDQQAHPLHPRGDQSGIWEGYVAGVEPGVLYKYRIEPAVGGAFDKADPFARRTEAPPLTASVVARETRPDDEASGAHHWKDDEWMARRAEVDPLSSPSSTYEMHLGSWRRAGEDGEEFLGYRDLAEPLGDYLVDMGYTHVEFLPLTEHPFYGSWGYQCTGFFAPTARYGSPDDLKYLIDALHARGIGVILDWVPSHFPGDAFGPYRFDGTALYEHEDPRQGYHPDWSSWIFNYGRDEVASFLLSSALYWFEEFHVDGLRVDAVASMLYLDYSRKEGEWIPNIHGGRENLEAIAFLRHLNEAVYRDHPGARMIAEESTAWPMVSRPTYVGGLGFGQKWNMGWMHDTLAYFREDPVNRKYHQGQLTFSLVYAFSEHFVLSLSHDEVVHGKGSLVNKMPGDEWQKFANLRAMYGYMFGHPGKKLVFMGGEFGQYREWSHDRSLDWHLLLEIPHQGLQHWCRDLNHLYRSEPALFERDSDPEGFRWVDANDVERSTLSFLRFALDGEAVLVACNFTPMPREGVRLGVPASGYWRELLNSDARIYGGSGVGNAGGVESERIGSHGYEHSVSVVLPPLSVTYFKVAREGAPSAER